MKEVVSTESYVEQYAREHKLGKYAEQDQAQKEVLKEPQNDLPEKGIPSKSKKGIPSDTEKGIPEEVKRNVKNTGSKG